MTRWLQKRWVQNTLLVLVTAAIAYGMVYVDVIARARESFRQGDLYMNWNRHPENKTSHMEQKFLKEKAALDKKRDKGKITQEEYDRNLEIIQFDRDHTMNESSIKYAYQWYKDTYELFSPPESKWVRRARFLAPMAKEIWRDELRAQRIPFEEYMLDLEVGEESDTLMVFSTRKRSVAEESLRLLKGEGIQTHLYDALAHGRLPQEGIKIIVPREKFWQAHETLKEIANR